MFPGPRILFLVAFEGLRVCNEQAFVPIGPEACVDLVQLARTGLHCQQMHKPAHKPAEKHAIIERLLAVRFLPATSRVMKEDDVKIGAVGQLEPAQLAVGDDAEAGRVFGPIDCVAGGAVPFDEVAPSDPQGLLEYGLGEPGQTVADLHDRQPVAEVRNGNSKHRRALKLGDGLHASLAVPIVRPELIPHIPLDIVTRDELGVQARIEQFVEQHRVASDLLGNVIAARAQVDEARENHLVFVEQRQVRTAPKNAFNDAKHPRQRPPRSIRPRYFHHQPWDKLLQALS